jgi:hypothetical protein
MRGFQDTTNMILLKHPTEYAHFGETFLCVAYIMSASPTPQSASLYGKYEMCGSLT